MQHKYLSILFLWAVIGLLACKKDDDDMPQPSEELAALNLVMGNPTNAATDELMEDNYLMELPQYVLSYNRSRGIPNWVSWYLSEEWLGNTDRQDDFRPNDMLPSNWYHVDANDYNFSLSGFNRGHNCPSGDRTISQADNSNTFFMTNMIPQAPKHNSEMWNDLEQYCRTLAYRGNELYIIMGNYGIGGIGDNGYREKLAGGEVTVPKNIWKVIVVLSKGENDLQRVDQNTRVIAVNTENKNTAAAKPWGQYRVSVDEIEAASNVDLLSNLPGWLQDILESKVDTGPVQ